MTCPELDVLQGRAWTPEVRAHVGACGSCRLVMELIDERSQAAESRNRHAECARFEALIAVRLEADLRGAADTMLEAHLRDCAECRALAHTTAPTDDARTDHPALPEIDPKSYALGPEVARGGMGRIVAARDLRIGRPVAVKELLEKNASLAARFEREARVTARLQHPGIVPIYEIGRWESGAPFYAMRMVEGKTLRAALAERPTLEVRLALLPSVIAAAEAVAFAHAHHVIHRDLTPSNILVGEFGETVVIDWGLAKDLSTDTDDVDAGPYRRDPGASADLTAAGAVIGTASYMPPEQAAGERVDARADVYALGAILYHLLAGHAPHKGTLDDVLSAVKSKPPPPLPASAPRDVASIVGKAMARDPGERYPSAKELAAELTAFQAGRLVGAHEYTRGELLRRFVRRNKRVLAAIGIAVVVLAALGAFAVRRIVEERDLADQQRDVAEQRRTQSEEMATTLLVEQGRQELLAGRPDRAAALLAEAYQQQPDDFVVRFLLASSLRALETVETVRPAGGEPAKYVEVSPDGRTLLTASGNGVGVGNAAGWKKLGTTDGTRAGALPHFSPDGTMIASPEGSVIRIWTVASGRIERTIEFGRAVVWAGWARDGSALVAIAWDGAWSSWDTASWARTRSIEPAKPAVDARPAAGRDVPDVGELLAIASAEGRVVVWDWQRGKLVATIEHGANLGTDFNTPFDGEHVVTCGVDGRIKRWNASTGALQSTWSDPTGPLMSCTVARDGRIATASMTGALRVWEPDGTVAMTSSVTTEFTLARFTGDGARLIVWQQPGDTIGARDSAAGTVVLELGLAAGLAAVRDDMVYIPRTDGSIQVARVGGIGLVRSLLSDQLRGFDRDARVAVSRGEDGRFSLRDLASRHSTPLAITNPVTLSADGTHAAGWTTDGIAILRRDGGHVRRLTTEAPPISIALFEDGGRLAAKFKDRRVVVWDVRTGQRVGELPNIDVGKLDFDSRGRLWLFDQNESLRIWDPTRQDVRRIADHVGIYDNSQDGQYVAVSDAIINGVRIYDVDAGTLELVIPNAMNGTFDRSGHLFVHHPGSISVWTTKTWSFERSFPIVEGWTSMFLAADPTGRLVATSRGIWNTADGRIVAVFDRPRPALRIPTSPTGTRSVTTEIDWISFSRDGNELVIRTNAGLFVWDVRAETRGPAEISALVSRVQPWRVRDGRLLREGEDKAPKQSRSAIHGRVTYRGAPVDDASIFTVIDDDVRRIGVTGANGSFDIPLEPGSRKVFVSSPKLGAFAEVDVVASDDSKVIDVPLLFEASIAGRVVDRSGRPRAGVRVIAKGTREMEWATADTDAAGKFVVRGLRGPREYPLIVRANDGPELALVRAVTTPVPSSTARVEGIELVLGDPDLPDKLDPGWSYRLTTVWQTPARTLTALNRRLEFRAIGRDPAQRWRIDRTADGYQLSTQGKHLGLDGQMIVAIDSGRSWKLVRQADGSYAIQLAGDPRCLTGGLGLTLEPCANKKEQAWLLTPIAPNRL